MYATLLLLHLLAATIWTGGHIVLSTCILPRVLKERDVDYLLGFESRFERVGMPALLIQIVTGLALAYNMLPDLAALSRYTTFPFSYIWLKLLLLLATFLLALNARFRVIPTLNTASLPLMAGHIVAVTLLSILFVVVGVGFRVGGYA